MSITYSKILRQAGIRIGAYKGVPATIATNYPTVSNIVSANFPPAVMKDSLRATEEEMCMAVANNRESTLRDRIGDITTSIASGAKIPTVGSSSTKKIIGVYGAVKDVSNSKALTEALSVDEIRLLIDNPNSLFKLDYYSYFIIAPRIYHTRTNVTVDVCVYDAAAQEALIESDSEVLFPEQEGAYFSGLMTKLKNEDERYTKLSDDYAPEYTAWLSALGAGRTAIEQAATQGG